MSDALPTGATATDVRSSDFARDLVAGLRQTLNSEEHDSPVFQMLPDLAEQDRSRFLPIPRDFSEEVMADRLLEAGSAVRDRARVAR